MTICIQLAHAIWVCEDRSHFVVSLYITLYLAMCVIKTYIITIPYDTKVIPVNMFQSLIHNDIYLIQTIQSVFSKIYETPLL